MAGPPRTSAWTRSLFPGACDGCPKVMVAVPLDTKSLPRPECGSKRTPFALTNADELPNVSGIAGLPPFRNAVGSVKVKLAELPGSVTHVHCAKFVASVKRMPPFSQRRCE